MDIYENLTKNKENKGGKSYTLLDIIVLVTCTFALGLVWYFYYTMGFLKYPFFSIGNTKNETKEITSLPTNTSPVKTDLKGKLSEEIPKNLPQEKANNIEQSYTLAYANQKQSTSVLLSTKTVKENYTSYLDFLKKESWTVVNKYEGKDISSLYVTKEGSEMNVTISKDTTATTTKSKVSVSVLKK